MWHSLRTSVALALTLIVTSGARSQQLIPEADIQTSGPVHEAFAQPFDVQPEQGSVVPRQPPEPIPELPPEERPAGDDVQWIPGYWAWDAEKSDFLWISGTYRRTPQDRQYVPGYWTETGEGWRWVAGYWAATGQPQVDYVPQPPAPLETGPTVPGPADSTYIPGYWAYQGSDFNWRPGYWSTAYDGRMWIPPSYRWTPAGYVFVGGYWDYPLADRGLLFAPVYFSQPLWQTAGWSYRPWYTVGVGGLLDFLFYRPRTNHFYFGNYFGGPYAGLGYRPWYTAPYSPYASYYRWHNRGNPSWYAGVQQNYAARATGTLPVPPRTLAQQNIIVKNGSRDAIRVVTPLNQVRDTRLTHVAAAQIETQKAAIHRSRELAQVRRQVEVKSVPPSRGTAAKSWRIPAQPSTSKVVRETRVIEHTKTQAPAVIRNPRPVVSSPPVVRQTPPRTPEVHRAPAVQTPRPTPHVAAPPVRQPSVVHTAPRTVHAPQAPARVATPTRVAAPPRSTAPARTHVSSPPRTTTPSAGHRSAPAHSSQGRTGKKR